MSEVGSAVDARELGLGTADLSSGHDYRSFDAAIGNGIDAYNEAAFRYFLGLERKRADLSNRAFLLLLVDLKPLAGANADVDALTATSLFGGLASCLRETDFVGWYRQGRVAGAVLTQHAETPGTDVSESVARRVSRLLSDQLPAALAKRIQVRVYELPPVMRARN